MTETGRNLLHPDTLAALQEAVDAIETEARDAALDEIEAKVRELADEAPASYVKAILAAIEEVRFSDAMLARIEEVRR